MESVYLETTYVSYLVSLPSRDVVIAAHQQLTLEWWNHRRGQFRCCVSQVVIDEASAGDPWEVQKRLAIIQELDVLDVSLDAESLTSILIAAGIFTPRAVRDVAHIAVATVHGVEYLLTWNCKHLANAELVRRVRRVCDDQGYRMPQICTPEELMGDTGDE